VKVPRIQLFGGNHINVNRNPLIRTGIPVLILLFNFIYRLLFLGSRDISMDEPFTLFYSQMPLAEILNLLPRENNPPLHFLLMHAWISIVGLDPLMVRLPSLIFTSLSAVMIYYLGTNRFSILTGLTASLLFTFSNFQTYLAQEARGYALLVLLVITSMFFFIKLIERFNRAEFLFLVFLNILLIYTHFFGFWIIIIQSVTVISFKTVRKRLLKPFILMGFIILAAYLPYLQIFFTRFLQSSSGTWLAPPTLSSLYNLLWKYCNAPVSTVIVISIILSGLIIRIRRNLLSGIRFSLPEKTVWIWFLLPASITFAISFLLPVFYEKYLVIVSPALYLIAGRSIENITSSPSLRIFLLITIIGSFIMTTTPAPYQTNRDSRLAAFIKEQRKPGEPILIHPGYYDKTFIYHFEPAWFQQYVEFDSLLTANGIFPVLKPEIPNNSLTGSAQKLFLIEAGSQYLDPDGKIFHILSFQYDSIVSSSFDPGWKVYTFIKKTH